MQAERRVIAALVAAALLRAAASDAALCGDTSGDGFFAASDALATLRMAVSGAYDRRGDVAPAAVGNAPPGDGKIGASDALASLRAAVETRIPRCHGSTATRAVVTTAAYDFFSSGGFAVVDLDSHHARFRGGSITGDAVIRSPSGIPIVVNRKNFNSLQLLDVDDDDLPTIKECSVSDGFDSNPQDVLLLSAHEGYVTAYKGSQLLVIDPEILFDPLLDPACNGLITGHIDLSSFDSDDAPEMDQMVLVGTDLLVSLQLLDETLKPTQGNGVIAVIDTKSNTVKGSIPLSFANPFAATKGLVYDEFQKLVFSGGPGTTGDVLDDGAIEAVDPVAMESAGVLLTGSDIHANIYDFVIVGTRRAFAIIADNDSNSVVDIDLGTRTIRKVLLSSTALVTDIEMTETGELWVAYRGETGADPPGLRIFRAIDDTELTAAPIPLGQAPFTLAFID